MRPRLLPVNQPIVRAWLDHAETQWRTAGTGLRTGLSYASVLASLQLAHPRQCKRLFRGIQVIERALLGAQREWVQARMEANGNG